MLVLSLLFLALPSGRGALAADILNQRDTQEYKTAFRAVSREKWAAALRHAKRAGDPLPEKAILWLYYQSPRNRSTFVDLARFVDANPGWPSLNTIRRRAELKVNAKTDPREVLAWFDRHPPLSANGLLHYIQALLGAGQKDKAVGILRQAWVAMNMTAQEEKTLRRNYRKWMTRQDNLDRLERLLWAGKTGAALRQARRVDKGHRLLAEARIALRRRKGGVDRAITRVPANLKSHPGLIYERMRWRSRKGRDADAIQLLQTPEIEAGHADLWWRERGRLARRALNDGKISIAYDLAAQHSATEGFPFADAEWLAGWIALRYLQEPTRARKHFEAMYRKVRFPVSLSRGAYWSGRAAEAEGLTEDATRWYRVAAQHTVNFYGQMAAAKLPVVERPPLPTEGLPSAADVKRFEESELVRLARRLAHLGAQKTLKRIMRHMVRSAEDRVTYGMIARLSEEIDTPQHAVYAARTAIKKGFLLTETGYPLVASPTRTLPLSITMAIIRQESAFDRKAISHAGARGLMQLMPATAKQVARGNRLKYNRNRLTSDGSYNMRLGQSYLAGLIDRFDGSLPMAFAGYNAGPHRVKRWVRNYGDPRGSVEETIDWIESIPFNETRNYVQRVLENLIVYRQRLEGRHVALNLSSMNANMTKATKP